MNFNNILFIVAMQLTALLLVVFFVRRKRLSFRTDIGIKLPRLEQAIYWSILFFILIQIEEYTFYANEAKNSEPWALKYTHFEILFRAIAIVILAPLSEELLFRGLFYSRLLKTKLRTVGAILIPAIVFTAIHVQYSEILILMAIFIDGIFYGLARHYSKSVVLTFFLHASANLMAIFHQL
ncbi:MAG: CPBP family intramembrane metalloprotease [Cyclobacteriaceae bacterium]|nr:CPBP family intramembrane metalloprotease [Cyclobacteriaceae bacterium]